MDWNYEFIFVVIGGILLFIIITIGGKDNIPKDLLLKILDNYKAFNLELESLKGVYIANSEAVKFKEQHNDLWLEIAKLSPKAINKYQEIMYFK